MYEIVSSFMCSLLYVNVTNAGVIVLFIWHFYDEKCRSRFSFDSDFAFGEIAPCRNLLLNFQNKSVVLNDDVFFKLSAIFRLCSSRVALREVGLKRK